MNDSFSYELITDFLQVFVKPVTSTLSKSLDKEVCTKIELKINSLSKIKDVQNLAKNKVIYQFDYTTGNREGALVILLPEELISDVSDILNGGKGQDTYQGSLSEIETSPILTIFDKMLKNIEIDFKKNYEHNLAFSSKNKFLLKEMPEYESAAENLNFDLLVDNTLSFSEDKEYDIKFLLNENILNGLIKDLGLSETNSPLKQAGNSTIDIDHLCDIKINITAELGRTKVPIKYALELVKNSIVELDTLNNADIKVFANGVEFAYAQVVAVEDNFGLKITKIISPQERLDCI